MLENKTKKYIEEMLSKLFFVRWDRYTNDDDTFFVFYGWIDREKDEYKDFVVITYQPEVNDWWATTSSAHYSKTISRLLGYKDDEHNECIRVETTFDLPNLIKL